MELARGKRSKLSNKINCCRHHLKVFWLFNYVCSSRKATSSPFDILLHIYMYVYYVEVVLHLLSILLLLVCFSNIKWYNGMESILIVIVYFITLFWRCGQRKWICMKNRITYDDNDPKNRTNAQYFLTSCDVWSTMLIVSQLVKLKMTLAKTCV